jgi:hypothetical protein
MVSKLNGGGKLQAISFVLFNETAWYFLESILLIRLKIGPFVNK